MRIVPPRLAATLLVVMLAGMLAAVPAAALTLIRDAEVESTLRRIADPLFRAAGMNPTSVNLYIVQDRAPNAFVAGGQNIFVHSGLLTELDGIDQVRAVLAHELGHITGGHLTRRDLALQGARGIALMGMLGAAAAAIGGSPEAGVAIAAGTGQVAQRSALAHSRAEEASADQASLRYLAAAGSDPRAMLQVLDHFRGQDSMLGRYADPYVQNHPLWHDRIAMIEERVAKMGPGTPPSAADQLRYERMKAKLGAFLDSPATTLRRWPAGDDSEPAVLARAVAWHRRPDPGRAEASIDELIARRPDDPYYHELKGQFLLETGRATAAAQAYRVAVELAPDEPLILGGLGRALLNKNDPADTAEARDVLARSARLDAANGAVLRDLALAEARLGNEGAAALATADRYLLEGRFDDARRSAARASALLPEGSPGWRRAEDALNFARRAQN